MVYYVGLLAGANDMAVRADVVVIVGGQNISRFCLFALLSFHIYLNSITGQRQQCDHQSATMLAREEIPASHDAAAQGV